MKIALLTLLLAPVSLACDLNVRALPRPDVAVSLQWDRYIGAQSYLVTESPDDFVTTRAYSVPGTTFVIPHRVSETTKFSYRVDAAFDPEHVIDGACHGEISVTVQPDAQFRKMVRKVIVPIVGSTIGANGAKFRTSLQMTSNAAQQRGRIVFHPAGTANESDPSIPYVFGGIRQTLVWDDIVAAAGGSGIGSLDIIPDDDAEAAPPVVLARHYTDATSGTYGSFEPAVAPFDFLSPASFIIAAPDPHFRLNLGFRTFTGSTVTALVFDKTGHIKALKALPLPADYFTLFPASQLTGDLASGETITFTFSGSLIPFYTLTENGTSDPAVVIPRPSSSKFVE
jgi:hypothetical protein